ncbi:MAG: hypothetical protein KatS3mg014_0714 [Actinomycetota bacterium]|nr:MAG: hypothetical protein KatS3mg014_0714 [Actinomycetota bacterium]
MIAVGWPLDPSWYSRVSQEVPIVGLVGLAVLVILGIGSLRWVERRRPHVPPAERREDELRRAA